MYIEQIYTGCLAHGAYYIESDGEAAVIDPLRDVTPYMEKAHKRGARIRYVLETHFHADFVSGHIDLAEKTGATIVYGPTAQPAFKAHIASDGELLKLGKVTIQVLHTPGHTMESACFLLKDEQGHDATLFTGDTLFIGDVGRPDLAVKTDLSREDLAGLLYDSLQQKICPLADDVIIYPGHGQGSACGKNLGPERQSTLGRQKAYNYALQPDLSKEEFIRSVCEGLLPPPAYFPLNATLNKVGYERFDSLLQKSLQWLEPVDFESLSVRADAIILDTRDPDTFTAKFIPGSINIGIDGAFAPWAGTLIPDLQQPILVVADPGREEEVLTRLSRVGLDNVLGFLKGGLASWESSGRPVSRISSVSASYFAELLRKGQTKVTDVRHPGEFEAGHLPDARNVPLEYLNEHMGDFADNEPAFIHCEGGYRSVIACSILTSRGYNNLTHVRGGMSAIRKHITPLSTEKI